MSQQIDKKLLKALDPLSYLSADKLDELARKSQIEKLPADRIIFRQGDHDNRLLYIISGQIELRTKGQQKVQLIKGKTDQACYPLAAEHPRPATAKTKTEITLLSIDRDLLEILCGDSTQQDAIEVTELSGEYDINDWMLRFLQSPAFLHLPTENIQALLMKLEEVSFAKDEVVVRQGDESDYYYIVRQGRCGVSHRAAPKAENIKLAILGDGDGFGEDALITGSLRNANITMLEDGTLMRLSKKNFLELLIKPLINYYDEQSVIKNLSHGSLVIDVRTHEEFTASHIDGSINIPLSMLRAKLPSLNPQRDYIVCCADSTQSEAAAFLLIQQGMNCHVLKGGFNSTNIKSVKPAANKAPQAETHKTREADENENRAAIKAIRLKREAKEAQYKADELNRKTQAAEKSKITAELKLKRLKERNQAEKNSVLQSAQQKIKQEKQRAEKAEQELQQLIDQQSQNSEHQAALQQTLSQAEKAAQESIKTSAKVHKQAEQESAAIRRQAQKEARQLRAEMDAEQQQHEKNIEKAREEEEKQQQIAINDARQKAREAVKITAEKAKTEAALIRQQAVQEVEALRVKVEETRSQLERNIADAEEKGELQRQMLLEEAQREAEKVARKTTQRAEIEAEQIRLKAMEEAEQLRADMEAAKQLVEREAEKIRLRQQREHAEEQKEEAKLARYQQQENKAKQRQQQVNKSTEGKKRAEARQRAEVIKAQLEASAKEQEKYTSQHEASEGLSIADFVIKETKDRIILESDEDVFVFKTPKITKINKEKLLNEAASAKEKKDDLPSFEIDSTEPMLPKSEPQFIGTMALDSILYNQSGPLSANRRKNTFAIAAVMVMGVGLAGMTYNKMGSVSLAEQTEESSTGNKATASLATKRISPSRKDLAAAERNENKKAEKEFESLLHKWKQSVRN